MNKIFAREVVALGATVLLAAAATIANAQTQMQTQMQSQSQMPTQSPVQSQAATSSSAESVRFLVVANSESVVSAVTSGRIATINVGLGDAVRAGQSVATIDCAETVARRDAARAELASSRVQYEAKQKLQGLQSAAEVEVEMAAANVNRSESQVKVFDAQVAQCQMSSPFAGRVARVHVKVGQGVSAGAPVMDIVGSGTPKAKLNAPSKWLQWLKVGDTLKATVDETGESYPIRVSRISGRVDAVSQTVELEASFTGKSGNVLPGMSGIARVDASSGLKSAKP